MKRKRGRGGYKKSKKVNSVKSISTDLASPNLEDSGADQPDDELDASENDPEARSTGADMMNTVSNIEHDLPSDKTSNIGHGRVKVKLKSSKISEPPKSTSDGRTVNETEKSNHLTTIVNETATEKEENTCSDGQTSELQSSASEKLPRKAGSIKIKSSKGLSFSNQTVKDRNANRLDDSAQVHSGKKLVIADSSRNTDLLIPKNLKQRETKQLDSGPLYNEKELSSALAVIKKVMKMDAAGPFSSPVDPVALGIPDYFDVIKTPMDFGTICTNLELRQKYMNSEDVYKDVQFIWDNCYTYNNKGDYIVDLMKRVKKNFMKYWLAAGLFSDMLGASEDIQVEDSTRPKKSHTKNKSKHKRRRYAIDKHKSDCLCAVCAVRRRRKEQEENPIVVNSQADVVQADFSRQPKLEENSPLDNSGSEDATSSLDHSPDTNVDMEEADNEEKLNSSELYMIGVENEGLSDGDGVNTLPFHCLPLENGVEDTNKHYGVRDTERVQAANREDDTVPWQKGTLENQVKGIHQEVSEKSQATMTQENPVLEENHLIFEISRNLFPSDISSVWNAPHSLNRRTNFARNSLIHAAVASLMKQ